MSSQTGHSQRQQKSPSPVMPPKTAKVRKSALKDTKKSVSRSRSPLRRSVQFANPVDQDMAAPKSDSQAGMMRMKDAREAAPRKEGESRQARKTRIFNYKRQEEAKHSEEEKKRPPKSK